tara:strand:+ start:506 stop:850 length:345 start_codon:yes stop_codon:yes gene_type:complete
VTYASDNLSVTLTRSEHDLLMQATVDEGPRDNQLCRLCGVLFAIAGVVVIGLSTYFEEYKITGTGMLVVVQGAILWANERRHADAIGLIRKLQGDPHQGRREIGTAIPTGDRIE